MSKTCQRCQSTRLVESTGKTSDCYAGQCGAKEVDGYVPDDLGIGGGDYLDFTHCLECGQIQGKWPLAKAKIEHQPCPTCGHADEVDE